MEENTRKLLSFVLASTIIAGAPAASNAEEIKSEVSIYETNKDTITYTVKEGDTLGKIAKRYFGNECYYEELAKYNNLIDPNVLSVGQVINIPNDLLSLLSLEYSKDYECDKTYTVKEGDTLYCIVRVQYGLTNQEAVDKLATYNNLSDPNCLYNGQVLLIPCKDKLMEVKQNDYSEQYNAMGYRLYHQENKCEKPTKIIINPCGTYEQVFVPCEGWVYYYPVFVPYDNVEHGHCPILKP